MSETFQLIAAAIQHRYLVSAAYGGFVREMCPHALGWKEGREQCLFFQFAGGSKSGLPTGGMWRCLPLDGLRLQQIYEGPWHSSPDYHHEISCLDRVTTKV